MGVDPALAEALGLDPSTAKMASHGGSGFASSSKLTGLKDGKEARFFVKTGSGADAEVMFRGKYPHSDSSHLHSFSNSQWPSVCRSFPCHDCVARAKTQSRRTCLFKRNPQYCSFPLPEISRPRPPLREPALPRNRLPRSLPQHLPKGPHPRPEARKATHNPRATSPRLRRPDVRVPRGNVLRRDGAA